MQLQRMLNGLNLRLVVCVESNTVEGHSFLSDNKVEVERFLAEVTNEYLNRFNTEKVQEHLRGKTQG